MTQHHQPMAGAEHLAVTTAWFETGGVRIYYEITGDGDPILVLPGFAGNIMEFTALREALVAASYQVIAADLPGSGRSEPQPRIYERTYYEDDAASFAALLDHLGVAPTHLLGFSDGGEVALLMAALTPEIVRSVVTWGSAGQIVDPEGQLRELLYNVVDHPIPPMQSFRDYLVATYGEAHARAMTQNVVAAFTAIVDAGGDISLSKVGNISCPVLLIAGEHDFIAPKAILSQLGAAIAHAKLEIVAGAGHDLHHSHGAWLTQTIMEWLETH